MTTGWQCPKCKKVYSPSTSECGPCNKAVDEAVDELAKPGKLEWVKVYPTCPLCLGQHSPMSSCLPRGVYQSTLMHCLTCNTVHEGGSPCPNQWKAT